MDQTTSNQSLSTEWKLFTGLAIISLISGLLLILFRYYCINNRKVHNKNVDTRSSRSIESFQQYYFSQKSSTNQIDPLETPTIERWTSVDLPPLTFYRVYMQPTNLDNLYQPVTKERLYSTIEQSKAMEYVGLDVVFF